jgi:allantoicase
MHPDGGIGRFRLYGEPTGRAVHDLTARWFNHLPEPQAVEVLTGTGLPPARLVTGRPLLDVTQLLAPLLGR